MADWIQKRKIHYSIWRVHWHYLLEHWILYHCLVLPCLTMLEYAEDDHGPTPEEQLAAVIDDLAGEINGVTLMTLGIQQAIDELEAQLKTAVAFG